MYANFFHTRVIDEYQQQLDKKTQEEKAEIVSQMVQYNRKMFDSEADDAIDPFTPESQEEPENKHVELNALEEILGEVIGYITIPKINVKLPIYGGTSDWQLQKGVGVLEGTPLPIGGPGSHSVITGHRGLPTSRLFSDLPELDEKDSFFIDIVGKRLQYEVVNIETVLPEDVSSLVAVPDQDYLTLLTCTPYMINTHRLLVRGIRVPFDDEEYSPREGDEMNWIDYVNTALIFLVLLTLISIRRVSYRIYRILKIKVEET